MASCIQLLDCTLRDGGYINDWNFGQDNLVSIFERVVDAGVEIVEIGFLDERRSFDPNRSIMPDTDCVEKIYGRLEKRNTKVVGMIDYGTCGLEHIKPAKESFLDGIRVIFKKHLRREAMAFCKRLREFGYLVFAQLVSVTSYQDEEMLDLAELANDAMPYAVSMVDTYGLMHQDNLLHYFEVLNAHLRPEIGIGYHGHNNFQMGYANCIEYLKKSVCYHRQIVVDGTLFGMGKAAGNAPIELIAMHLNTVYGKHYRISQFLEAIDTNISSFTRAASWGYSLHSFIAAYNDCHPNYVSYLVKKRTLSIQSVNEVLGQIEKEKKLLYNEAYIETLYYNYLDVSVDDAFSIQELTRVMAGQTILLLGPGNHINDQYDKINDFIQEKKPVIISVNFIPERWKIDYLFLSNSKRYVQLAAPLSQKEGISIIATSNVTETNGSFAYKLRFASLLCGEAEFRDNPFLMLLKVMIRIGQKNVYLAGFDGYVDEYHLNYVDKKMEYHYSDTKSKEINEAVSAALKNLKSRLNLYFVTDTLYEC